jgi:hypothetical protein
MGVLLAAARALPVYVAGNGTISSGGRSMAGAVVQVSPQLTSAWTAVLAGNGAFRHGGALDFPGRRSAEVPAGKTLASRNRQAVMDH